MASETWFQRLQRWGVDDLLASYGGLTLTPVPVGPVKVTGQLVFEASARNRETIKDEYGVEIAVPDDFPRSLPAVRETGGRIAKSFHTNPDGTLCLGSPTRLRLALSGKPSLERFVTKCVVPYLYGHAYFEKHGVMPFSELRHGESGVLQDLATLYSASSAAAVVGFVRLTGLRKRIANKASCPCGSGRRLGRCHSRRVNYYRRRLGRGWFTGLLRELQRQSPE
jgi:hypothetical protein